MDYVLGSADRLDWQNKQIHIERFSATADTAGGAFAVHAELSGVNQAGTSQQDQADILLATISM